MVWGQGHGGQPGRNSVEVVLEQRKVKGGIHGLKKQKVIRIGDTLGRGGQGEVTHTININDKEQRTKDAAL